QANVPLVLVVGDEPTSGPRPWDVDQIAMASAVGVRTYTVGRVDAAAATVTAIEHALTYRVPVVLAIPYDVATVDIGTIPEVPGPAGAAPLAPDSEFAQVSLDRLAEELSAAKRPLLLAGRGAWLAGATTELRELAPATEALTATTALGGNHVTESEFDHADAAEFGAPAAMERIRQADVAVFFVASFSRFTKRYAACSVPSTTVCQVVTAVRATYSRVGASTRSDACHAAQQLVSRLRTCAPEPDSRGSGPWRETVDTAAH